MDGDGNGLAESLLVPRHLHRVSLPLSLSFPRKLVILMDPCAERGADLLLSLPPRPNVKGEITPRYGTWNKGFINVVLTHDFLDIPA